MISGTGLWDMIRHGLLEMPLRFGLAPVPWGFEGFSSVAGLGRRV